MRGIPESFEFDVSGFVTGSLEIDPAITLVSVAEPVGETPPGVRVKNLAELSVQPGTHEPLDERRRIFRNSGFLALAAFKESGVPPHMISFALAKFGKQAPDEGAMKLADPARASHTIHMMARRGSGAHPELAAVRDRVLDFYAGSDLLPGDVWQQIYDGMGVTAFHLDRAWQEAHELAMRLNERLNTPPQAKNTARVRPELN
jgi:hypothetical protein